MQKYLECSPSRYYLRLRLLRAGQLLKLSSMSIIDIAAACGFVSSPHFSKCYREQMGIPPRDERLAPMLAEEVEPFDVKTMQLLQDTQPQPSGKDFVSSEAFSEAKTESTFGSVHLKGKRDK